MPTTEWNDFDEMPPQTVFTHLFTQLLELRRKDGREFKRAILVPLGLVAVANLLQIETRE